MYRTPRIVAALLLTSAVAASAWAQHVPITDWSHGTTLNGFGGMNADSKQSGPLVGGAAGWELTPALAIEGSGGWTEFGHGTTSFAGAVQARLRIAGRRQIDPFVQAGVGLYRMTFGRTETAIPDFYARRMTDAAARTGRTFTDPTLVAGGGVSVFLNRHIAVRPDVQVTFVRRNGDGHTVTTMAVHLVYHFEHHPVTPTRRSSAG